MLTISMLPVLLVLFFIYRKEAIRHHMKEELEKQSLHVVTVKNNDIIWVKAGKEIFLNGKMFDIKTTETKNGYTTFKGLYDKEETTLKQLLDEGWGKKGTDKTNVISYFFQLLKGLFNEKDISETICFAEATYYNSNPDTRLISSYIPIPTPPPQV